MPPNLFHFNLLPILTLFYTFIIQLQRFHFISTLYINISSELSEVGIWVMFHGQIAPNLRMSIHFCQFSICSERTILAISFNLSDNIAKSARPYFSIQLEMAKRKFKTTFSSPNLFTIFLKFQSSSISVIRDAFSGRINRYCAFISLCDIVGWQLRVIQNFDDDLIGSLELFIVDEHHRVGDHHVLNTSDFVFISWWFGCKVNGQGLL